MPTLVKFMLRHALIGYAAAAVFVGLIFALDVGGLRSLVETSSLGILAVALLTFFTGLTFASLQMGMAIMSLKSEEDEGDGMDGHAEAAAHWEPRPAVVKATVSKTRHRRR